MPPGIYRLGLLNTYLKPQGHPLFLDNCPSLEILVPFLDIYLWSFLHLFHVNKWLAITCNSKRPLQAVCALEPKVSCFLHIHGPEWPSHSHFSYAGNRNISNMAIIDVKMLSGFVPVSSSLQKVRNGSDMNKPSQGKEGGYRILQHGLDKKRGLVSTEKTTLLGILMCL